MRRARRADGDLSAKADIVRRRADLHIVNAGLDEECTTCRVIPGELFHRHAQVYRLRLARLQLHSLEGPQAPDWLIRAALLQVRVELRDFRSGAFAGIAQFERDVRLSVRVNGGSDVEMAVREARIAQAEAKRIQWESFEVLVGESIVDGVVVRGRHVVEARVNRVGQMAAGI